MALYDFVCENCGQKKELVNSINEPIVEPLCVSCDEVMTLVYGVPKIVFVGEGWAKNDHPT